MQERMIWQTPEGKVHIGRKVEQLGICLVMQDKSFGTFAEYVNYVKCRIHNREIISEEIVQELAFIEYIFSSQDKVAFPSAFKELVAGMGTIDKVGHAV